MLSRCSAAAIRASRLPATSVSRIAAAESVSRRWLGVAATGRSTSSILLGQSSLHRFAPAPSAAKFERLMSSAAAARADEPEPEAVVAELEAEAEEAIPQRRPFASLKKLVDHDTLKALIGKPFKFETMSEVQERVLGLMPGLIGVAPKKKVVVEEGENVEAAAEEAAQGEAPIVEPPTPSKEDLLVKAKTGTGKTIAFLVPGIDARVHQLEHDSKIGENGEKLNPSLAGQKARDLSKYTVGTLVISPTRELATQIANEAIKLHSHHRGYETQLLVGGNSRMAQLKDFRRGRLDVVVATPGRLRDLLENEQPVADALASTNLLVLDEADTLLDMGFSDDLNFIISKLPKSRQTFLFSATVSPAIRKIARASLKPNHRVIDCVPENESNTHMHIPQYQTIIPSAKEQLPHVLKLLAHDQLTHPGKSKSIVFLPTTKLTQLYATFIRELSNSLPMGRRTSVYEIHSKLDQNRRSRASEQFRRDTNGASILVTSDVSARGVDYPGVTRVIQVGISGSAEQYIHRVGRTGRGGKEGGRGDIVLLPWEAKFGSEELKEIPMTKVSSSDVEAEVRKLAEEFDEDPQEFARRRGSAIKEPEARPLHANRRDRFATSRPVRTPPPITAYVPRLEAVGEKVESLLTSLDPEAVTEVFMSMLGYYIGKAEELRTSPMTIVQGLKLWAVEAGGLVDEPYVGENLLKKLGAFRRVNSGGSSDRRAGFGRSSGGSGQGWGSRGRSQGNGTRGFGRGGNSGGYGSRGGDRDGGYNSRGGDRNGGYGPRSGGYGGGFSRGGDRDGFSGGGRDRY